MRLGIGSVATAELDVLIGHPEHDLLFMATQVARAAGLKAPADSIKQNRKIHGAGMKLGTLMDELSGCLPTDTLGRRVKSSCVLFSEHETYQMLLRGHAPASDPFRKWVTEEVLPSIRKTGSYNVNESTTETGQQFAGELSALHDAVAGLLKQNSTILGMLRRRQRGHQLVNP